MKFTETPLQGALVVDLEPNSDERGFFARTFCTNEFEDHGLMLAVAQCSVSFNPKRGTLRGMHFQAAPHEEDKLVRCATGAIFDVIIDIRPTSRTRGRWFGIELTAANRRALFVPRGFAHGFITLAHETEVFYMISTPFAPGFGRGIRWNDPAVAIQWPLEPIVISQRDASYPSLSEMRDE